MYICDSHSEFFYWEDYSVKFVGKNNKEKKKNEERKE
jgi:hypothetical protein